MITAEKLEDILTRLGVGATLRTYPAKTFDATTNKTTLGSPTDVSVKIVPPYRNREGFTPTELVSSGKALSGVSSFVVTPVEGDKLIISSKEWTITGISEVRTSVGIIYYQLEIEV